MNKLQSACATLCLTACLAWLPGNARAADTPAPDTGWPRIIVSGGATNTLYQPQLESWDGFTLKARMVVSSQPKKNPEPIFGILHLTSQVRVDKTERLVYLEKLEITSAEFPSVPAQANAYLQAFRTLLPKQVRSISLDRVEANLAILEEQEKAASQPVRNDPPRIIISTNAAMLIMIDGEPVYRPVAKTQLDRVFNTHVLLLRDKTGKHYLHLFDGYIEAPSTDGPWKLVKDVPSDVKTAESQAVAAKQVDLLAGKENPDTKKKPSLKTEPVPQLYFATKPTELIVTTGTPQWTQIPNTRLIFVTNTASHFFRNLEDQKMYVLLTGRWFSSPGLAGPWEYVAGAGLPADFAKIPEDSPKENAKAAVPGTHQAQEAVIANTIPQTVKVNRAKANMDPQPAFDGAPLLKPIEGTALQYAANCATPIIVADAKNWFACQNGVWFTSAGGTGPWAVATNVPAVIYSIPPSSPVHYVTYVRIYKFDKDYVWVGTLPGYYGAMVGTGGTVVYGTGYDYPAYIGSTVYVAYPVTYGYAVNTYWAPWCGWHCGFSSCWYYGSSWYWWCYCPPAPYWGPYWGSCYGSYYNAYGGITSWGPYGWAGTTGNIYTQNGPWSGTSRYAAGYNAWTGNQWASQYGHAYNSVTGTSVAGRRGAVENVYTGSYASGGKGVAYNQGSGAAAVGGKITMGNVNTGNEVTAGRASVYNPNTGNVTQVGGIKGESGGIANINGNVIAGKDGQLYRPDGSGGWQPVNPSTPRPTPQANNLNNANLQQQNRAVQNQYNANIQQQNRALQNQYNAQQMGAQRQQSYQMNRPAMRTGGGGSFRGRR